MAGVNPVGTYQTQDFETQTGTAYKTAIDNNMIVGKRIVDSFAPHAKASPDMNVLVDAGAMFVDTTLVEQSQQTIGPITAPATNPRIDRIVIDRITGAASRIAGAEAGSPTAPVIPDGKLPCARVALATSTTTITNSLITDERVLGNGSGIEVKHKDAGNQTVVSSAAETTITAATKTIAGGTLGTVNWLDFFLDISDLDNSGDPETCTLRAKYGGTTFASIVLKVGSAVQKNNNTGTVWIRLCADGGTSAQYGTMKVFGLSDLKDYTTDQAQPFARGTAAQDSTADKDFTFTVQHSASNSSNSITVNAQYGVKYS